MYLYWEIEQNTSCVCGVVCVLIVYIYANIVAKRFSFYALGLISNTFSTYCLFWTSNTQTGAFCFFLNTVISDVSYLGWMGDTITA